MVLFSDQDIRRECGSSAFEAGSRYHRQARVLNYAREDDIIRAAVKGSQKKPYRQTIKLMAKGSGTNVAGHCSCPVGHNCKHVAAALLHGLTIASAAQPEEKSEAARQLAHLIGAGADPAGGSHVRHLAAVPAPEPDLPIGVLAWLDDLARATLSSGEDYPAEVLYRMMYVMCPVADGRKLPTLGVQTIVAKLKKDGSWSQGSRPYAPVNASQPPPKYLRPSDHRILSGLSAVRSEYRSKIFHLSGETGEELLAKMLGTGRARWLTIDGPPLRSGPPRPGQISWQAVDEAAVLPRLKVEGEATALAATPPVYVDVAAGLVGPIDTGQPPRIAAALFRAPPVAPAGIPALKARLSARVPTLAALAPPRVRGRTLVGPEARPCSATFHGFAAHRYRREIQPVRLHVRQDPRGRGLGAPLVPLRRDRDAARRRASQRHALPRRPSRRDRA